MSARGTVLVVLGCLLGIGAAGLIAADVTIRHAAEREPRAAAEAWLALLDAGQYDRSRDEAATRFRQAITADAWAREAAAVQARIGDSRSRSFRGAEVMEDPTGAHPGEYLRLRYDSRFAAAPRATELVVVVRDGDRGWRVAAYFVQPRGA